MACYAPVSLRSPNVCRAAVGVNAYQCQSLTIVGMLLSLALICCSDLYFVFSLSMYLTGLALLFVSQRLSNDLFYVAEQYGSSDSKEWNCDTTEFSLDSSVKFDLHFFAAEPKKMWPCYCRGSWDGRGGYSVDRQFWSRLKYLWNHGLEILSLHSCPERMNPSNMILFLFLNFSCYPHYHSSQSTNMLNNNLRELLACL